MNPDYIYVDEAAQFEPEQWENCRNCGMWRLLHVYKIENRETCDNFLPLDNLRYLEHLVEKEKDLNESL